MDPALKEDEIDFKLIELLQAKLGLLWPQSTFYLFRLSETQFALFVYNVNAGKVKYKL